MADIPTIIVNRFQLLNASTRILVRIYQVRKRENKEALGYLITKFEDKGTLIAGILYVFIEMETTQQHKAVIKVLDYLNIYYALHYN